MVRPGVAGAEVDQIAVHNARAARGIVWPDLLLGEQVVLPDDVGVGRPEPDGRAGDKLSLRRGAAEGQRVLAGWGEVGVLGDEWPGVAVGQAVGVEAEDFAV